MESNYKSVNGGSFITDNIVATREAKPDDKPLEISLNAGE